MPKQPHRLNNPLAIYDLHADNAIIALYRAGASDAVDYHHRHGQHLMTPPIASTLARNCTHRCKEREREAEKKREGGRERETP